MGLKLPLVKINRKTRELILSGSTELFETKQVGWWQRLPNNRFLGLVNKLMNDIISVD